MLQVQVNQGKSRIICAVDGAQSGIGEVQGVKWRVIHRGTGRGPIAPGAWDVKLRVVGGVICPFVCLLHFNLLVFFRVF